MPHIRISGEMNEIKFEAKEDPFGAPGIEIADGGGVVFLANLTPDQADSLALACIEYRTMLARMPVKATDRPSFPGDGMYVRTVPLAKGC